MNSRIRKVLPLIAILLGLFAVPAAAQAAQHITWKTDNRLEAVQLDGFNAVSCASSSLCVGVDNSGRAVYTTTPLSKSAKSWHYAKIERIGSLSGISCPSPHLCVAVDASGKVLTTTNPNGGAGAWTHPMQIDTARLPGGTYAGLSAIACPNTGLCVAVDNSTTGGIVYTTDPTGPAYDWHRVTLGNNTILDTVSCPSRSECVVGGTRMYYSLNPAGGVWHAGGAPSNGFIESVACPSGTLCVGAGYNGTNKGIILASNKVTTASPSQWKRTDIVPFPPKPSQGMLDTVACANPGFCITLDTNDNAYTTLHPGEFKWDPTPQPIRPKVQASRSVITCKGNMCVTMDSRGVEQTGIVSN